MSTIDYQDAGDKPGKLTVAGVALPGKELFLFLDDQPFTNTLPDASGNWSVESEMKLTDGRHTFRADQYDKDTQYAGGSRDDHLRACQGAHSRTPRRRNRLRRHTP